MDASSHRRRRGFLAPAAWIAAGFALSLGPAGSAWAVDCALSAAACSTASIEVALSPGDPRVLEDAVEFDTPYEDDTLFGSVSNDEPADWTSFRVEIDRDDDAASSSALHWSRGTVRDLQAFDTAGQGLRAPGDSADYELEVELGLIDDRIVYSLAFERDGTDDPPAFASRSWKGASPAAWLTTRAGVAFDLDPTDWSPRLAGIPVAGFLPATIELAVSSAELAAYVPETESGVELELGWDLGLADAALSLTRSEERSGLGSERDGQVLREGEFELEFEGERWSLAAELEAARVSYAPGMWLESERGHGAEIELSLEPHALLPISLAVGYAQLDGYSIDYSFEEQTFSTELSLDLSPVLQFFHVAEDVSLDLDYEIEREQSRDSDSFTEDELSHEVSVSFELRF